MSGQSSVSIPAGALALEGVLGEPSGAHDRIVVVCHPHPQFGGDMYNNVVLAIAAGLVKAGIGALTFNFRGVGASEGSYDEGVGEQDDVKAALAFARSLPGVRQVGLAGYSFGALMAATVADDSIPALGLVSMPMRVSATRTLGVQAYAKPVLLVAGERDHLCAAKAMREMAAGLPATPEIEVVAGTDHFWYGREDRLASLAGSFFQRHLPGRT